MFSFSLLILLFLEAGANERPAKDADSSSERGDGRSQSPPYKPIQKRVISGPTDRISSLRLPNPNQNDLLTRPATHSCNCPYHRPIYRKFRNRHRHGRSVEESMEDSESYRTIRSDHPGNTHGRGEEAPSGSRSKANECEFRDTITCDKFSKYRTINGSCNNLANPYWGMAETPLVRFACFAYDDGFGLPRRRGRFGRLPEPREIRLVIHERSRQRHELKRFTHFLMAFGQMLSHDILENVVSETPDGDDLDCCGIHRGDPNCIMPLKIRRNDPFFSQFGKTCLNFSRSEPSPDLNCNFEVRQTITEYTQYIDGSSFYGSDMESYPGLREFSGGRLRTQNHPNGEGDLMPAADEPEDGCRESNTAYKCFLSGDGRVNQQAALTGQHTIWLREHNRIARKLETLYGSTWNDEKIFQEARRIVGAMFQHITYSEYLPVILGNKIMRLFNLKPKSSGKFFKKYNPCVNPNMRHGFMAAAFRFGHSMINDNLGFQSSNGNYIRRRFRELFNKPDPMYKPEGVEQVMRGLYIERCQSVDRFKSVEVTNHLFERDAGTGGDLIATNINRGRDHGLPPYMEFRKMCGLSTTRRFSGLRDHSRKTRRLLRYIYAHVFDMDLFTAGVTEEPLEGALVGPTFACLIGLQFKALKFGDRFYYENNQPITGFTLPQLDEIKKTTLAQVICRNTNIGKIPEDVFRHGLPEVYCSSMHHDIDLSFLLSPLLLEARADKRLELNDGYAADNTQLLTKRGERRSQSESQQYGLLYKRLLMDSPSYKLIQRRVINRPGNRGPSSRLPNPQQNKLLTRPATHSCRYPFSNPLYRKIHYRHRRSVEESLEEPYSNSTIQTARTVHTGPKQVTKRQRKTRQSRPRPKCEYKEKITCYESSKYRTIDGSCNNLANPYWGKSGTPLIRFVCSAYDDGHGLPRRSGVFGRLPEPREIRLEIHERSRRRNELKQFTHFLMAFGQLLDHDILGNILSKTPDGHELDCCGVHRGNPNCIMPLKIRKDDPFFGHFGKTCLNFARSQLSPDLNCNFKVRQTITESTHYIDGSPFYGSDLKSHHGLREFVGGRLRTQNHPSGEGDLMPAADEAEDGCRETNSAYKCFLSGDVRANEQPSLTGQHTIWLREHNRIARKLERLFGRTWNDEKIFQEARRIVGAIFQHITYNEYLPVILGKKIMKLFHLRPKRKGNFFKNYKPFVNPNNRQSFMTAAFRFGHSTINDHIGFMSASGEYNRRRLRQLFLKPDPMYQPEGVEQVMRGLYIEHCQTVDRLKSAEITDHLFEIGRGTGSDLIAININRARDHGLPPYMELREMCGLSKTNKFSGLLDHSPQTRRFLRQVYDHVYDVDLFTGGVLEETLDGAVVGPTFACIIGLQFKALKFGDRFYYENHQPRTGFTLAQLDEIKKTTLAQVICRNTNIGKIQKDVFRYGLPEVDCSYIDDDIDFSWWKES
ncbi:uncharacterized protein LOC125679824 [Ostrea edulis]|uniref:uncharacterized protein LOC125679824 n=1 Tax=Ostrea edulis TaxID=37623 RepID=UPI0024AFDE2E|nr:uncharacterized protein LOC125679824 [Ostrea edulis]